LLTKRFDGELVGQCAQSMILEFDCRMELWEQI